MDPNEASLNPYGGCPMNEVSFNFGAGEREFMEGVQRTLAEQPDFKFIGGHGLEDHGGHGDHGTHRQTVIGIGDTTVNFRELLDEE